MNAADLAPAAAWSALALAGLGAAWPRPVAAGLTATLAAVALALRLPASGAAALGLAGAAGLAWLAARRPAGAARGLLLAAVGLALPGALAAPPAADLAWPAAATVVLAGILAAGAIAAVADAALAGRLRFTLPLVLALAPLGPGGVARPRWPTSVVLEQAGVAVHVLAPTTVTVEAAALPLVLGLAWWLVPGMLAAGAVWAWTVDARRTAPPGGLLRWLGPALAAVGVLAYLGVELTASATLGRAALAGDLLLPASVAAPGPVAGRDLAGPGLLVARLLALGLLLALPTRGLAAAPPGRERVFALGAAVLAGLALAGLWLATAAGWHGPLWPEDPAALALVAALAGAVAAGSALARGPSLVADLGHLLLLAAACALLGGADAGLAVAGVLLPGP